MKFVIEAAGLTVAGGKELALDLMSRLAGHTEHQFTFVVPDLPAYKALSGSNTRTIVCKTGSGLVHRERLLNQEVPKICRAEGADALLCLGNFAPRKRVCPTAVLLQNAWIVYGDPVAESHRTLREHLITAYGRHAYRHLRRDVTIITQTPVMKDHLCKRYGIGPRRVAIIPNTLSLERLGGNHDGDASGGNGSARPFTFLCLAHCYAHKNIDILLDAVRRLRNYTGKPAKCLITVAPDQHPVARRLLELLGQDGLAGKIENIGPVPSDMLPQVYHRADALIFPTLLESFTRTYLEALYFGLPILTSDRDFARHLCQNAAIYFDPLDADGVARAMARMMEDAGLRQRLVENGLRILAKAPTWDELAGRFVDVLERTARGEPPIEAEPEWETRQVAGGRRQKAEGSGQKAGGSRQWAVGGRQGGQDSRQWAAGSRQVGKDSRPQGEAHRQITSARLRTGPTLDSHRPPLVPSIGMQPADSKGAEPANPNGVDYSCPQPGQGSNSNDCLLPTANCLLSSPDVRTLFNYKAHGWRSKYGPRGKLNSRVEQFTVRLAELCSPPAHILDMGCGTGEIAAAIDQMGYQVTACDFAEEMIAIARRSSTSVNWVCLEPDWQALPFPDGSFDGIVASSVFEYLDDVPSVAAELSRVLRPDGVLLLTVPNPCNWVRKLEARVHSLPLFHRLSPVLRKVQRIDSYAAYLRLSRNRFAEQEWQSLLGAAHFTALDEREFSREAWQHQAQSPLVLLAVKRVAVREYALV